VTVSYEWHWEVLWQSLPMLLEGVRITVLASVITMLAALVLGLVVALARIAGGLLGVLAYAYVEFFRNSPQLMVVVWVFTVLPLVTGIALSPLLSGIVALALNVAAFVAEVYRAGITSIPAGQTQAAMALGMTRAQLYRRVLLPQAIARVIPPLGSYWVSLFKDTSLLAVIGVAELMYQGRLVSTDTYRPVEILTGVALIYYVLAYPQSLAVNYLFRRFRVQE
jgi:His/Glu/Gln/Arg/opine family amino acid ABC transporter permease subunit